MVVVTPGTPLGRFPSWELGDGAQDLFPHAERFTQWLALGIQGRWKVQYDNGGHHIQVMVCWWSPQKLARHNLRRHHQSSMIPKPENLEQERNRIKLGPDGYVNGCLVGLCLDSVTRA